MHSYLRFLSNGLQSQFSLLYIFFRSFESEEDKKASETEIEEDKKVSETEIEVDPHRQRWTLDRYPRRALSSTDYRACVVKGKRTARKFQPGMNELPIKPAIGVGSIVKEPGGPERIERTLSVDTSGVRASPRGDECGRLLHFPRRFFAAGFIRRPVEEGDGRRRAATREGGAGKGRRLPGSPFFSPAAGRAFPAVGKNGKSIIAIALTDSRARRANGDPLVTRIPSPAPAGRGASLSPPFDAGYPPLVRSVSLAGARASLAPSRSRLDAVTRAALPQSAPPCDAPAIEDDRHYRFRCE